MKKVSMLLLALTMLLISVPALAAPTQSYQVWYADQNLLIVHATVNPDSEVCYSGVSQDYDGYCVSPMAPTADYRIKQAVLEAGNEYSYPYIR